MTTFLSGYKKIQIEIWSISYKNKSILYKLIEIQLDGIKLNRKENRNNQISENLNI